MITSGGKRSNKNRSGRTVLKCKPTSPNPGDFQARALLSPGCLEGLVDVAGAPLT